MDTIATIILTAVVNFLVTSLIGGLILYRIQKKIDNSYFEHQTKFSISYPKTLEVMEALHQKFYVFVEGFLNLVHEGERFLQLGAMDIGIDNFRKNYLQLRE